MRTAFYARVSTQRQAQADGIAQQLDRLQGRAQAQGWPVADEDIFRDDGYSGANLKRPGLERLRDRVALRVLDRVLITAPDRLARHYVHQVLLLEEITATGCQVEFLDRPMSQDPHDQLLLQIRGAVAEYERSLIAERMRRGRLRKLQAGLLLPWTRPPYGFCVDPERPRDPAGVRQDGAEAAVVATLFALYAEERCSLFSLARKLQRDAVVPPRAGRRWNVTTVRQILTNPVYTGQIYAGRIQEACGTGATATTRRLRPREDWIAVAPVPAMVTQEQFDRVQDKLAQNQQFARRNNTAHAYLLRALVSCGVCGLSCSGRCPSPGYRYYQCRGKLAALHSHRDTICPSRHVPAAQRDALVWDDLRQVLTHPETIRLALERAHVEWLVARVVVTDGEVEIRYVIPTTPAGEAAHFCHLRSDYRAPDQPPQAIPPHRHPLREARHQLPGHGHARHDPALAVSVVCRNILVYTARRVAYSALRIANSEWRISYSG